MFSLQLGRLVHYATASVSGRLGRQILILSFPSIWLTWWEAADVSAGGGEWATDCKVSQGRQLLATSLGPALFTAPWNGSVCLLTVITH